MWRWTVTRVGGDLVKLEEACGVSAAIASGEPDTGTMRLQRGGLQHGQQSMRALETKAVLDGGSQF